MGSWSYHVVVPERQRYLVALVRIKLLEGYVRWERLEERLVNIKCGILCKTGQVNSNKVLQCR